MAYLVNRSTDTTVIDLLKTNGAGATIDGTWGDWTLQEGDENIFMKNNRTGKEYKINLTEV